jgi:eukaryotic-like serine/threonine-protein kinase
VLSATDRDRELRPESAVEMRRDLESIASGLPVARSLAAVVSDLPEVSGEGSVTERVPLVASKTQTIPRAERTKRRRARRFSGIVLLLVAVAASAWGAWTYLVPHHADVPPLIGTPVDEAKATLIDLGFNVKIADTGVYQLDIPADGVAKVVPPAGTSLEKGETVTLVPSLGPKPVRVPDLEGKTIDEARTLLGNAHLRLGQQVPEFSDQPVGIILRIDTELVEGKAPRNSAIDVVVSKGPRPVPVPNVVGASVDDAKQALEELGFVVDDSKTKFSNAVERGRVIRQSPAEGQRLQPGETVSIVVSLGPKHFPAPDFRGLSRGSAQDLADSYGLVVTFVDAAAYPGTVVTNQSVPVGATLTYGDPITLYLV